MAFGLLDTDNRPMMASEDARMAARQRRLKQLKEERAAESSRQAEKKAAEEAAAEEELAEVESRDVRAGLGGLFRRG